MPEVVIGNEFFRKEVRNYSNGMRCFWRELIQNSVDAMNGVGKIIINIIKLSDTKCRVEFIDNGKGMNRDILENVFFSLGNTTKGQGKIGGFGKARIALFFAQDSYSIETQNMFVIGSAGSYEIAEQDTYFKGCKVTIDVDCTVFGNYSTVTDFQNQLERFLNNCTLRYVKVFINDVEFTNWCPTYRRCKDLSFGTILTHKSDEKRQNIIIVRVSGVEMFTIYSAIPFAVVLELFPEKSRDILLSNRDGINSQYLEELETFKSDLLMNTRKALKEKKDTTITIGNPRRLQFTPPVITKLDKKVDKSELCTTTFVGDIPQLVQSLGSSKSSGGDKMFIASDDNDRVTELLDNYLNDDSYTGDDCYSSSDDSVEIHVDRNKMLLDYITDGMMLVDESTDPQLTKVVASYKPEKWKGTETKVKLLHLWIIACESALTSYCQQFGLEGMSWRHGYFFSDDVEAINKNLNNSYFLGLNPLVLEGKDKGKLSYSIRDYGSYIRLITLACHEVAHCSHDYHNEAYANLMTDLVTKTFQRLPTIIKRMKKSIA